MRRALLLVVLLLGSLANAQSNYRETDDIVYTQASGVPETLDLFVPMITLSNAKRPGIIFVHGGGWSGGSKEDYKAWGQYYAGLGYVCVSINYRLAPQYHWPAQIDDTQAAVRWMRRYASLLNLDPNRIGAVGASAGGHLVLFLGETDTLHDFDPTLSGYSSKVQIVADYFGPTDFSNPSEWDPSIWQLIVNLLGVPFTRNYFANYAQASPLTYVSASNAPMLIFQGDADPIVPVGQSRRIVTAMQNSGVAVSYFEYAGQGHGFDGPTTWASIFVINTFFQRLLGR